MSELPYPTELQLLPDARLLIVWSDLVRRSYRFKELRDGCPCANCREKQMQQLSGPMSLPILVTTEPLKITGMRPLGQYAYNIAFNDGHDTGIYTFELLRELGEEVH